MAGITRFEEIEAWKTARQLTNMIYDLSNQTGFNRDFGLRDQIRRASVSMMSNIAEDFESRTNIQFINFLGMAKASAGEVRAQLYVTFDQKYITEEQFKETYVWLNHLLVKLQNLALTLKPIQKNEECLMMMPSMKFPFHPTFDFRRNENKTK